MKPTTQNTNQLDAFDIFRKGSKQTFGYSNNCVIYTRVSTKEQADNNMSLTTQKKACELYAQKHEYNVTGCFGGTYESAKTDERKEFNKMLAFVKKTKEKVSYIIVYSVDRFSRSGANAIYITEQLRKSGVMVVSVTQPTDSTTPSGSLQQNIQYIFSEYDNQLRREKCMSGVKEALLRGEWCHAAPLGYDIVRKDGKRLIVVNEKGQLLRKAFLWKAKFDMSNEEIRHKLAALGFNLIAQRISAMFRNPFYCGLICHSALEGKIIEGNHEALISKEIFLKVNNLLSKNAQGYTVKHENEEIPLKNFVKCGQCGNSMPGYAVKKKGLWYYKCRTIGCCNNKSAKALHNVFLNLLEPFQLYLTVKTKQLVQKELMFTLSKELQVKEEENSIMKNQLLDINSKLDRLEERFIFEEITKEQYVKFSEKFKIERTELYKQIEKSTIKVSNLEKSVEDLISLASKLRILWSSSNYEGKVKLQNFVFPSGIRYFKKKDECLTEKTNPLFSYILHLKQVVDQKKIGTTEVDFNYSDLVELQGVEPWSGVGNDGAFYMFSCNYCRIKDGSPLTIP